MLKRIFESVRRVASRLATVIGWRAKRDYVVRPWTKEENADFARFCESIGKIPEDPVHARLMEDGPIDFFTVDPWYDMELPRA